MGGSAIFLSRRWRLRGQYHLGGETLQTIIDSDPGAASYNERLFGGQVRRHYHLARFRWLANELRRLKLKPSRIIEVGCHDARTLAFLPMLPVRYLGLDANWDSGIEIARAKWSGHPGYDFAECKTAAEIPAELGESFDIGIAFEVFEHLSDDVLDGYLAKLRKLVNQYLFISVPVERGVPFVVRHALKKAFGWQPEQYTAQEFCSAAFGSLDRVERDNHKGFDYKRLVSQVDRYFQVETTKGISPGLPGAGFNFNVGITAAGRR
jgi:hypothetical protein